MGFPSAVVSKRAKTLRPERSRQRRELPSLPPSANAQPISSSRVSTSVGPRALKSPATPWPARSSSCVSKPPRSRHRWSARCKNDGFGPLGGRISQLSCSPMPGNDAKAHGPRRALRSRIAQSALPPQWLIRLHMAGSPHERSLAGHPL